MRRVFRLPLSRARLAREIDDELAFHIEHRIQQLISRGLAPDGARQEAMRQFGDVNAVRQSCVSMDEQRERAMQRSNMIEELYQNTAYAFRTLRRNFGVSALIVVALAIGIGANTSIFTLVDAVLVQTLPVAHPEQIVAVGDPARVGGFSQGTPRTDLLSYPLYRDIRDGNHVFTGVLASARSGRLDVRINGTSGEFEHPRGRWVSSNYFSVLGIHPSAGRAFDDHADDVAGAAPVAVISAGYLTRRFHDDASIVGHAILVDGVKITIIGVGPKGYTGDVVGSAADIWLPIGMHDVLNSHQRTLTDRNSSWLLLLGRLEPGATLARARAELVPLMQQRIVANAGSPQAAQAFLGGTPPKYYVSAGDRGFSRVRSTFRAPLITLMIGVGLLMCIICANVANLLLARAIARGREMAIRLAMGAGRARLVRQLLTESAVLAIASTALGLLFAWWGSRGLLILASLGSPGTVNVALNMSVLSFAIGVAIVSVMLFGVVPALRASRIDLASTIRANAHAVTGSPLGSRGQRAPLGKSLIAGQVALSVVLLVGAAMLVRSLRNVQSIDLGLDRDHLILADVDVNAPGYSGDKLFAEAHALRDRLAAIPGVAAVTFSENGIFSGTESATSLEVPGFVARDPADTTVAYDQVGANYARDIGATIALGRDIDTQDEGPLPRTALVNRALADFYFPHESAVGKYLHFNDSVAVQIVGVIADTRDHSLTDTLARRVYFPFVHAKDSVNLGQPGNLRLIVRTHADPAAFVQTIRKTIVAVDPALPIDDISPLTTLLGDTIRQEKLLAQLATGFGVLALLLAAIGLYGVMTYAVTRRTGEIGLRAALGAQRGDVIRLVFVDALTLVGIGLAIGLPLAVGLARMLQAQLHGIGAIDPASVGIAVGVLGASAVVAVLIPALRASAVPPIVALRAD